MLTIFTTVFTKTTGFEACLVLVSMYPKFSFALALKLPLYRA